MDFVERVAREYEQASEDLMPWFAYARDCFLAFDKLSLVVNVTNSSSPYANADELRADMNRGNISVWSGGVFAENHPLRLMWPKGFSDYPGFEISRVVHDYHVHGVQRLSFESKDELWGALEFHESFSPEAQPAMFTDDVAIACYYMARGTFPKIQRPVVVEPDWAGLRTYLLSK